HGLRDLTSQVTDDPLDRGLSWMSLYSLAQHAMREFRMRFDRHLGSHAAWLLLQDAAGATDRGGSLREQGAARLGTAAKANLPRTKRRREMEPDVTGQIWLTLQAVWGDDHPLALFARALDGNLNHAGLAIARDVLDGRKAWASSSGERRRSDG